MEPPAVPRSRVCGGPRSHASLRRTRRETMPDRASAASRRSASCPPRYESPVARHAHELREPACLGPRYGRPERLDAVIPAALVVQIRRGAIAGFHDQALFEHALDGAVKRSCADLELSVGAGGDILDDGIAMPVLFGHGKQNVEGCRGERQEGVRLWQGGLHALIIATMDILSMAIGGWFRRRSSSLDSVDAAPQKRRSVA